MKLLKKLLFFSFTFPVIAMQSCCLTGNNASKQKGKLVVISDKAGYRTEIQHDSNFRMIRLTNYLQPFSTDWQYATTHNFTHEILYYNAEAYLRLPAAKALKAVQQDLAAKGIGLKLFDAYRPYSVTKKMWQIVPDERYAANPAKGSGHNRGIAVDLTLVSLPSGIELAMPTAFDDFSEKAHHDYMQLDSAVIANRSLLRTVMEKHGFKALETEWWHYYFADGNTYPILDFDFDQMRTLVNDLTVQ